MLLVLRLYPGVSPTSVYDLEHLTWAHMALAIDKYVAEHNKRAAPQARPTPRRR